MKRLINGFGKMLARWRWRENIERPHLLVIDVETVNALAKFPEIPYPRERAATNGREWAVELSGDELLLLANRARQTAGNLIAAEAKDGVRALHGPALLLGVLAVRLAEMVPPSSERMEFGVPLNYNPVEAKSAFTG